MRTTKRHIGACWKVCVYKFVARIVYKHNEADFPIFILSGNTLPCTLKRRGVQHIFIPVQHGLLLHWLICIAVHLVDLAVQRLDKAYTM